MYKQRLITILAMLLSATALLFSTCITTSKISNEATRLLIDDTVLKNGFIGISIFDLTSEKYLYNYNADKYFIPASNTKLFTLYAGMKYLGDSLVGIRYRKVNLTDYNILASGDPTFLHKDFSHQPVLKFLSQPGKEYRLMMAGKIAFLPLGKGWSWDDYNEKYMVERSCFPAYGNTSLLQADSSGVKASTLTGMMKWSITPKFLRDFVDTERYLPIQPPSDSSARSEKARFKAKRDITSNKISLQPSADIFYSQEIPLYTDNDQTVIDILRKDLNIKIDHAAVTSPRKSDQPLDNDTTYRLIYSQPSDSLFKPMMHRSDNFFAEQTLLMVSNEHLGFMSDKDIIDTLLSTELSGLPQKVKWVDGSGLSRYNLSTPQDLVYMLNKIQKEFGLDRIKNILPTGGEGNLADYFLKDKGFVFAKTGTLSNNSALSGYIITKKNRVLIFSVLANNYLSGSAPVRRLVEKFITMLREKY